ncbi:MAG: methyl-accepting chemotaxis protein [bacterium]|jgi:methyl-accepting chemotaxis protein|nr:methyl-accepting chemotaxis protein [Betaproteobacteria bacterium]
MTTASPPGAPGPDLLQDLQRSTDRLMLATCMLLLVICVGMAATLGGLAQALMVGIPALAVPLGLYLAAPGSLAVRLAVAASLMIFSALMIQLSQGLIEMHFGIFVLLAFLLAYCDWRPVVFAAAVIALHHLGFDAMQRAGFGVYVFPQAQGFGWVLLHAAYVVVEAGVLCYLATMLARMVERSQQAVAFAGSVAEGRLDHAFDQRAVADSPMIAALERMQSRLVSTLQTAGGSARQMAAASASLADSARRIAEGSSDQTQAASAAAVAVDQIGASVNTIAQSAQQACTAAEQSAQRAALGATVIEEAVGSMRSMARSVNEAAAVVETLGEKSAAVQDVVRIIRDIAEQTNLLALNAAIEAARAGDAGRGFAVVADEVRKLSDETGRSTGEISRMIEEIMVVRAEVTERIADAVQRVDAGLSYAGDAGATIGAIREQSAQARDSVREIAAALEQHAGATGAMSSHVARIAAMTGQAREATTAIAGDALQLSATAEALGDAVGQYRLGA